MRQKRNAFRSINKSEHFHEINRLLTTLEPTDNIFDHIVEVQDTRLYKRLFNDTERNSNFISNMIAAAKSHPHGLRWIDYTSL